MSLEKTRKENMRKYREEIEKYIEEHQDEMVEDIKRLCSIDSEKSEYVEGAPLLSVTAPEKHLFWHLIWRISTALILQTMTTMPVP